MKLSDLKGKAVVSVGEARKLGSVEDVLVDPSYRRIEAVRVRAPRHTPDYVVSSEHIRGIGPDAVTIVGSDALQSIDRIQNIAATPSLSGALHSRIVTEGGDFIGSISEIEIDVDARLVRAFGYTSGAFGGLFGQHRTLDPSNIISVGPGLVTVRQVERAAGQG